MYRLAWRLKRGWPTVALRRAGSNVDRVAAFLEEQLGENFSQAWSDLEWREADLSDVLALEDAMAGCHRVFHAAGRVSFQTGDEAQLKAVNQVGTSNVVNAALGAGVQAVGPRVIGGRLGAHHRRAERRCTRSRIGQRASDASPYGRQQAGRASWRPGAAEAEGMEVIVVNPTIILGDARYDESSGMVYRRVATGRAATTPPGAMAL